MSHNQMIRINPVTKDKAEKIKTKLREQGYEKAGLGDAIELIMKDINVDDIQFNKTVIVRKKKRPERFNGEFSFKL